MSMNSVIWLAGHGTVSSLFEITTTSTTTIPKKNFRLYVNLAVAVFLASVFYLVSCRVGCTSKYKSWIMELPNDWGHSVFRALEKIWQMRSNLCASTISVFGMKIENEFYRQKERPEPEKWQVLSITNIHTYTCIMHTSNAYTVNLNQLVDWQSKHQLHLPKLHRNLQT